MNDEGDNDWTAYFGPDETLVWAGHPEPDGRVRWSHVGLAAFGTPFFLAGAGLFGTTVWGLLTDPPGDLWQIGMSIFLIAFSLPFLGAGLAMIVGPYLAARLAHTRVRYALSTRRAYVAKRWWARQLEAYPILPDAIVELHQNGHDTVVLHVHEERDSDGDTTSRAARFEGLADGSAPYRLIRDLQSQMKSPDRD